MQTEKIIIIEPEDVKHVLNNVGSYTNYYIDIHMVEKITKADLVLRIDENGKATIIKNRGGGNSLSEDASMIPLVRYYEKKYGKKKEEEEEEKSVDRFELMDLE